ncbi:TIGR03862 family flavoprotein [Roseomonas sp. CCTCC AB2023176]|uniref:TIGR03862 family flavoprotein n=1 Tax=Roseomonas sp. CCTCC AB2023176 TaxID=3342640 RepID=UPI0035D822C9
MPWVVVIGAGPAGLMAAEGLSDHGIAVTILDRMPSPARKLLIAGRGGLNLTHTEPLDLFLSRYGTSRPRLEPHIRAFPPEAVREWAEGLGQETFAGTSGRVFPRAMKAAPLLRAWLRRLDARGVRLMTRHTWTGWSGDGALTVDRPGDAPLHLRPDATILALGGASWPRLGSDAAWVPSLTARGVTVAPFTPSNAGALIAWSPTLRDRFAGTPLKRIAAIAGGRTVRGEALITAAGLEGGAIYALSPELRGGTVLHLDLRPDLPQEEVARRFAAPRRGQSLANHLRRTLALPPAAISLLREGLPDPSDTAARIKALPLPVTGLAGLGRAISSAGGVRWGEVADDLSLRTLPDILVAGEMLDWEAPTGGHLLTACFATGRAAAQGVLARLRRMPA